MPSTLSAPPPRTLQRADLDLLQGSWQTVAGHRPARLLIAGHRFTFEFCDHPIELYMGSFLLDDSVRPRQMDMLIEEGPSASKGQLALCIYQVETDVLRWCPTKPGCGVRLTHFPSVDDQRFHSVIFKPSRAVLKRPVQG